MVDFSFSVWYTYIYRVFCQPYKSEYDEVK